jgi:hypothetical protein
MFVRLTELANIAVSIIALHWEAGAAFNVDMTVSLLLF